MPNKFTARPQGSKRGGRNATARTNETSFLGYIRLFFKNTPLYSFGEAQFLSNVLDRLSPLCVREQDFLTIVDSSLEFAVPNMIPKCPISIVIL